jgi:hypothetical protein
MGDRKAFLAQRGREMLVHDSNLRQHGRYYSTAAAGARFGARSGTNIGTAGCATVDFSPRRCSGLTKGGLSRYTTTSVGVS